MTNERRLAVLTEKANTHTKTNSSTKASAIKALVKEGLYTKKGALSPNYGGAEPVPTTKRV